MSFLSGIVYALFVIVGASKLFTGIIPAAIFIGISAYSFSAWYTCIIAGICCLMMFGRPARYEDIVNATEIQRRYGIMFDLLGALLFVIGAVLLIISFF